MSTNVQYDCSKCPGYCCSYGRIPVSDHDLARLAKHFDISPAEAKRKFSYNYKSTGEQVMRHHKDEIYGSVCRFFDREERRCTVYKARPHVCRAYPNSRRCGYYTFLKFERDLQDDQDFVPEH